MEVNKPPAVIPPVGAVDSGGSGTDKRANTMSGEGEDRLPRRREHPRSVSDIVTSLAGDITPEVQKIIDALMARIDSLNIDLERAEGRERFLERQGDRHSFLNILNRRAFLGYLARILTNVGQLGDSASLIMLHLANGGDIRRRYGRLALDRGLKHMAGFFPRMVHQTDPVGGLGGNDFGIVLLVSDAKAARIKGEKLVNAIKSEPFIWHDNRIFLEVALGVCELADGLTNEQAINIADRDMLSSDNVG